MAATVSATSSLRLSSGCVVGLGAFGLVVDGELSDDVGTGCPLSLSRAIRALATRPPRFAALDGDAVNAAGAWLKTVDPGAERS